VLTVIDKVETVESVQSEYRRHIHVLEINQAILQDDIEDLTNESRAHYNQSK